MRVGCTPQRSARSVSLVVVHSDADVDDADVAVLRASGVGVVEGGARRIVEDAEKEGTSPPPAHRHTCIAADMIAIAVRRPCDTFGASLGLRRHARGDHSARARHDGGNRVSGVCAATPIPGDGAAGRG